MPTGRVEAIIQALGSVLAALVIAVGAWAAARSFQPEFIRWGNNVASLEHLVLVGDRDDGSGCSVLFSFTVPIEVETPDGPPMTILSGQPVDDDFECEEIRRALAAYAVDARPRPTDR